MKTLKDFDKVYRDSFKTTFSKLEKSSADISSHYRFDLRKKEISEAVLERMKNYYSTQEAIKIFLDKRYQAAGADYFVETVLFFLRLFLQSQGEQLQAHSEEAIRKRRGAIRPDITVWQQGEVIAMIECKTQLGYNRGDWEPHFNDRERKLKSEFPKASAYLLVMTGVNWGGFGPHSKLNSKYFCLLNDIHPINYSDIGQLMTPLEGLFKQLRKL